jgi:hypothetical protein
MRNPDASFDQAVTIVNAKVNRLTPWPGCGVRDWQLDQDIYGMHPYAGMANPFVARTGGVYPIIVLNCANCGNLRFFSAIMLGLVKPDGSRVLA